MISDGLKGKTALVTGGADGLGSACARTLAASGTNIVLADLNIDKARKLAVEIASEFSVKATALPVNLHQWDSVKAMCLEAIDKVGTIDILIDSGASNPKYAAFAHEIDPASFEDIFRIYCWARLYPIYGMLEHMKSNNYGKIVVLTSDAARTPTPKEAYVGGCAATLVVAGKVFSKEWARWGIRVNTICLTMVKDSYAANAAMEDPGRAKLFQKAFDRAVLGPCEPQDIANAVLFFAAPESDKITGGVHSVNGGLSFPG